MSRSRSRIVGNVLAMAGVLLASVFVVAEQTLDWAADDGTRVATLKKEGARLESQHVNLWFPKSFARADAEALVRRLDPGVAGLWQRVGPHKWQAVPQGKITYYLSDDAFVAHATGRGAVFVPIARVQRRARAVSARSDARTTRLDSKGPRSRRASTPTAIVANGGVRRLYRAARRRGCWDHRAWAVWHSDLTLAGVDAGVRGTRPTPDGATMLPYVGGDERPDILFTTDRSRFAPTFYACSFSFVKYLADRIGLNELVNLFAFGPTEMRARLDRFGDRTLSDRRTEWLRRLELR